MLGILKAVLAERDPELVRGPCQRATAQIEGFCPKAAEVLEEAEADGPAYLDFPYGHHVGLRANNVRSAPTASSSAAAASCRSSPAGSRSSG